MTNHAKRNVRDSGNWVKSGPAILAITILLLGTIELFASGFLYLRDGRLLGSVVFLDKAVNKLQTPFVSSESAATEPAPATTEPAPAATEPATATTEPATATTEPAAATTEPATAATESAPATTEPATAQTDPHATDWKTLSHRDRKNLTEYKDATWIQELVEAEIKYYPFSLWRAEPNFSSTHINTTSEGLRVTPGLAECDGGMDRNQVPETNIFLFGGSLVYGDGFLRDEDLIGIKIQCLLHAKFEAPLTVKNYSQSGYNLSNSIITLTQLLMRGDVPDVALFYFGFNEIAHKVYASSPHMAYNYVATRIFGRRDVDKGIIEHDEIDDRLDEYFDELKAMMAYVKKLETSFGFKASFIFNPDIFSVSGLNETDVALVNRVKKSHPKLTETFKKFHLLKSSSTEGLAMHVDECFSAKLENRQVFVDIVHLTPIGNSIAASCVADLFDNLDSLKGP